MPAIGSHAAIARTRGIRLVALALSLLFLASIGAVTATPAAAKDWTPQIQATRRAQIYWESVMRSADAELRRLRTERKQSQKRLSALRANQTRAVEKRAKAKRKLRAARKDLGEARERRRNQRLDVPQPPDAAVAMQALVSPSRVAWLADDDVAADPTSEVEAEGEPSRSTEPSASQPAATEPAVDAADVRRLERQAKQAKRGFKQARRQARRGARNARAVQNRLTAINVAMRNTTARRESAERSLGSWILAMTKYGRIRATKKSDVRPGVNSSFGWPARGRISQRYHAGHDGLDIVSYNGSPVRSMAFGVVTYVGWNPWDEHGRAFMVVVTHAGGYETLYGHLKPRRIVRVGEEVKKGQTIGYMGNTGNSTGTHLHLELRRGRTTLNPLSVL